MKYLPFHVRRTQHLIQCEQLILNANLADHISFTKKDVIFAVKENDQIIGMVKAELFQQAQGFFCKDIYGILKNLAVEKLYKKRGIGSALVTTVDQYFIKQGVTTAALCTMFYTFSFFRKHGYETMPRNKLPIGVRNYPQFTDQRYKKCAVMLKEY
jgi:N-acetylglutamate synthase-like GNAT family acetyltransferase